MEASSRQEAKRLGLRRYRTGKPCRHGHFAERRTSTRHCVECLKLAAKRFKERHPDRVRAWYTSYWQRNSGRIKYRDYLREERRERMETT